MTVSWPLRLSVSLACLVSAAVGCHRESPPETASAPDVAAHAQRIVEDAAAAVNAMRGNAKFAALPSLLQDARAVIVFPRLVKASFIVGGEGGTGVLVARGPSGELSAPAFYGIGSGSFGPQIGYREAAVVLLLMNDGALSAVLRSGLTLGANASVAFGNDTGQSRASTATKDVVAFVDADGVFAGASIDGVVVEPRPKLDRASYGKDVVASELVLDRKVANPGAAVLRTALGTASGSAPSASASASAPSASASSDVATLPGDEKAPPAPTGEAHACSPESRQADVCTMIYAPVCAAVDTGIRCIRAPCPSSTYVQFSNACEACKNRNVREYFTGECATAVK